MWSEWDGYMDFFVVEVADVVFVVLIEPTGSINKKHKISS